MPELLSKLRRRVAARTTAPGFRLQPIGDHKPRNPPLCTYFHALRCLAYCFINDKSLTNRAPIDTTLGNLAAAHPVGALYRRECYTPGDPWPPSHRLACRTRDKTLARVWRRSPQFSHKSWDCRSTENYPSSPARSPEMQFRIESGNPCNGIFRLCRGQLPPYR